METRWPGISLSSRYTQCDTPGASLTAILTGMGNFCIWETGAFFWVYRLFLMCQRFIVGVKGLNKVSQKKFSSLVWCKIWETYRILPLCWSCLWTLLCWHPRHGLCSATQLLVKARATLGLWALYILYPHLQVTYVCPLLFPPPALASRNTIQGKSLQSCTGPLEKQVWREGNASRAGED